MFRKNVKANKKEKLGSINSYRNRIRCLKHSYLFLVILFLKNELRFILARTESFLMKERSDNLSINYF